MANKLAGQRAKFSKARASFFTSLDDDVRERQVRLMAAVLTDAPINGFTEQEVTQGADVPDRVNEVIAATSPERRPDFEDNRPEELVAALGAAVLTDRCRSVGTGDQWVYAYGYRCAPDRLKVGSSVADPVTRVANQISTGTPDKPDLVLTIATHDCRALERALHGALRLRGRRIDGAGAEWFLVSPDEIVGLYEAIVGLNDGEMVNLC